MAIGTQSNFKLYNEYTNGTFFELFAQNVDVLNARSNGAIAATSETMRGAYDYESFFQQMTAPARRDPTSTSTLTPNTMTQEEIVRVKLHREANSALTRSQWLMVGQDPALFGRIYGAQLANGILREQVNTGLAACNAALSNQAAMLHDGSDSTLATADLVSGLSKFGDAAADIVCWVMHSKPYYDLVTAQITEAATTVSSFAVQTGTPTTLGRPVIVTDSTSLVVSATGSRYITLGLTRNAIQLIDTATPYTLLEEKTGYVNILLWAQTEYAYNLGIKGYQWDVGNGGANPIDASVATAGYWDKVAADDKFCAGIRIRTQ